MADGGCSGGMDMFILIDSFKGCYKYVKKAVIRFCKQALNRKNLRYLLYYALANFAILLSFTLYQRMQSVNLDLKPTTSPVSDGSFMLVTAVILLPFSLLVEEFAFRYVPMFYIKGIFHLNSITISIEDDKGEREVAHSRARWWLYHHWLSFYLVVSSIVAAGIHQLNIVNSDLIGSLIYFGVQAFSGVCFAWIYSRHGLGASWAVHTAWDLFLVCLNLIMVIL